MTKYELAEKLSKKAKMTAKKSREVIDVMFASIRESISRGEKVEVRGFGTFGLRNHKAMNARNPRTGETARVPAKKHPKFKPSKLLNAIINEEV